MPRMHSVVRRVFWLHFFLPGPRLFFSLKKHLISQQMIVQGDILAMFHTLCFSFALALSLLTYDFSLQMMALSRLARWMLKAILLLSRTFRISSSTTPSFFSHLTLLPPRMQVVCVCMALVCALRLCVFVYVCVCVGTLGTQIQYACILICTYI